MRKIKLYIACSLDGYIATADDGLDWLIGFPNPDNNDYGYNSFYETVDTLIMGGKTYRVITNMGEEWPYSGKTTYLISRNETNLPPDIIKLSDKWLEEIANMKEENGKDIWLMGGGEIISPLVERQLIDEMIITYIPTLLGKGIPLFPPVKEESVWKTIKSTCFESGVLQATFEIVK